MPFVEILPGALVLDDADAGPEEVYEAPIAGEFLDRFLKGGELAALLAEDFKEFVPEGLALGLFRGLAFPVAGEGDGAVFDSIP
jgi:hypothetical protein